MDKIPDAKFKFPREIKLVRNSLVEAWLQIKWDLEESNIPNFFVDKAFPFALGVFYDKVKNEYPFSEELDSSKAPEGMLPYVPQYRFRVGKELWPLLQLGPGIATLNLTRPYSWESFKKESLYLRSQLLSAYQPKSIRVNSLVLKYRNAYPFEYSKQDLQRFLYEYLNTQISLPNHIPGEVAERGTPIGANLIFTYKLTDPVSIGTIRFGTGESREKIGAIEKNNEIIVWEFELITQSPEVPSFEDQDQFSTWLEKAHSVIHEWFFSSIEGNIYKGFSKPEEGKK